MRNDRNKRRGMKYALVMMGILLILTGCSRLSGKMVPVAGLVPTAGESAGDWQKEGQVEAAGEGNIWRTVTGAGLETTPALELAAGNKGTLAYRKEIIKDPGSVFTYSFQFLSTQGTGKAVLEALDGEGRPLAAVSWVWTGTLGVSGPNQKFIDERYIFNYVGEWKRGEVIPAEVFQRELPGSAMEQAKKFRFSLVVGEGQHALITEMKARTRIDQMVAATVTSDRHAVIQGELFQVTVRLRNISSQPQMGVRIKLEEPYGYGLIAVDRPDQILESLAPGEEKSLVWQVKAQRPHRINLGQPWTMGVSVNGSLLPGTARVEVADSSPGKVYYVMTEDLEPIDSAGYPVAWGNGDGWIQPEEIRGQMIGKAEALNKIADQYGAKWTHYIAWPVMKAAEWAAEQPGAREWKETVAAVGASVTAESRRGHEYGVHMHSDYDPFLAGNVISYQEKNNGIWANHLRHGWAHSIGREGNLEEYGSRTGILRSYQQILDGLAADSPQGQLLTSRVGSFDFGYAPEIQAASTRAYRKVGLWGSSDADGNIGGITSGVFGKELYRAAPDNINQPASDIHQLGLVEFRPAPVNCIAYDSQSAVVMNQKADEGMSYFMRGGKVEPGVHAITGFTHAMFVMGEGDWRTVTGGQFAAIDQHLAYLKKQYGDKGLLQFGTATELVKAYLDDTTPELLAVYGPRKEAGLWKSTYPIQLIGRDIPVDSIRTQTVAVKCPLYLRDSAIRVRILKNGIPVLTQWGMTDSENELRFLVDDRQALYTMEIIHQDWLGKVWRLWRTFWGKVKI